MKKSRGRFITFEGLDGCGKSTQLEKLAEFLRRAKHEVIVTREPGGTPIGESVRKLILDSRTAGMAPLTEVALMFASRAQQLDEVILPALAQGKIVLCDRFTDSSEAYQGGGRQLGSEVILKAHQIFCRDFQPDLTILLVSDLKASVFRARSRNTRKKKSAKIDEGRFELESGEFYKRVLKSYLSIAAREAKRVVKIDARQSISHVHSEILLAVQRRFPSLRPQS